MKKSEEAIHGCFAKAADDEPVFVLRAKDALAPSVVREWIYRAELNGVSRKKLAGAEELAQAMVEWAKAHGGAKLPD